MSWCPSPTIAGSGRFKASTLLKRVNAGAFDAVPAELMKWTKAKGKELPGLVRRRRAEAALWRGLPKAVDAQQARTCARSAAAAEADHPVEGSQCRHSRWRRRCNCSRQRGHASGQGRCRHHADPRRVTGTAGVHCSAHHVAAALAIWVWRRQRLLEQGA